MLFLYLCATLLTIFVGFRDAIGRNAKINKKKYYLKSVVRSFFIGQVLLAVLYISAYLYGVDIDVIERFAQRCFLPFSTYITLVLLTFIPYLIPNWEIKSMITVLIFGPLTTGQPIVIITTMLYALQPLDFVINKETIWLFMGCCFGLLFERFLHRMGWSKRDAQL